jgi:hypothetical protein
MPDASSKFLNLALSGQVVRTALRITFIVGTVLALINHGAAIVELSLSSKNVLQILLTYMVPYCVSTYSSVKALQAKSSEHT